MTPAEVSRILALLSGAYRERIEPETAAAYTLALQGEPYEPFARAACELLSTSEFLPTIAALQQAVRRHTLAARQACAACGAEATASVGSRWCCPRHLHEALGTATAGHAHPGAGAPDGMIPLQEAARRILESLEALAAPAWAARRGRGSRP